MDYKSIMFEKHEKTAIIRLNRPERMNAVIEGMYFDIQKALDTALRDDDVRVVIITGSVYKKGDRERQAFCAGADLKEHASGQRTHGEKREYITLAHETTRMIYEFPKPVIACINGPARGAGSELALSCDLIFISEEATMAFPETGLATFVGGGVTSHLVRILGLMKAKDLVYSGRAINGIEAAELGLALRVLPLDKLMKAALDYAEILSEKGPVSMKLAKKLMQSSSLIDIKTTLQLETDAILTCMDTEDWHEGVKAFAEKRKPVYNGR